MLALGIFCLELFELRGAGIGIPVLGAFWLELFELGGVGKGIISFGVFSPDAFIIGFAIIGLFFSGLVGFGSTGIGIFCSGMVNFGVTGIGIAWSGGFDFGITGTGIFCSFNFEIVGTGIFCSYNFGIVGTGIFCSPDFGNAGIGIFFSEFGFANDGRGIFFSEFGFANDGSGIFFSEFGFANDGRGGIFETRLPFFGLFRSVWIGIAIFEGDSPASGFGGLGIGGIGIPARGLFLRGPGTGRFGIGSPGKIGQDTGFGSIFWILVTELLALFESRFNIEGGTGGILNKLIGLGGGIGISKGFLPLPIFWSSEPELSVPLNSAGLISSFFSSSPWAIINFIPRGYDLNGWPCSSSLLKSGWRSGTANFLLKSSKYLSTFWLLVIIKSWLKLFEHWLKAFSEGYP